MGPGELRDKIYSSDGQELATLAFGAGLWRPSGGEEALWRYFHATMFLPLPLPTISL